MAVTTRPQEVVRTHAPVQYVRGVGWPLAALALSVVLFMQIGTFARPFGDAFGTRVADWLDLLTPWAVVGAAVWVMAACRRARGGVGPDRLSVVLAAVGALAFAEGKGLHLAANSVSNAAPTGQAADIAHLWDEVVGHWIWFLGLLVLLAAVARTVLAVEGPNVSRATVPGLVLAVVAGFSMANTWIEGGTPWLGIVAALSFTAFGLVRRARGGLLWATAFGFALVQVVGWGLYWWIAEGRMFPGYYDVFSWL